MPEAARRALLVGLLVAAGVLTAAGFAPAASQRHRLCTRHMAIEDGGRYARVVRHGRRVKRPAFLQTGDRVRVASSHLLGLRWRGSRYELRGARANVVCVSVLVHRHGRRARTLGLRLRRGGAWIKVHGRVAAVLVTPNAAVVARKHGETAVRRVAAHARTRVRPKDHRVELVDLRHQRLRVTVRPPEKGIRDRRGLRLNTYPLAVSAAQRRVRRRDHLRPFWRDGRACSTGCRARGARPGWPLRPFHRQHSLRAGLNELRPANFHVGIDIQARDHQRVYPMSSGRAHIVRSRGHDERVQVGQFVYWHIEHRVHEGQHVRAYHTALGTVKRYYHHLHLSAVVGGRYVNPLRPGGRNLRPWSDTEPPVIGKPRLHRGGRVNVAAFDPQSYVVRLINVTPVLAPAALGWRLFDAHGHRLTGLEWALRGSQHLPDGQKRAVYTGKARNPGFLCFVHHRVCVPRWDYHLAGGLTRPLPLRSLHRGRYRLTVYAWDWAGNTSARDLWFRVRRRHHFERRRPGPQRYAPLHPRPDVE